MTAKASVRSLSHARTIARPAKVTGIGLFTGAETAVEIRPAELGTGLRFIRTDLPDTGFIPATVEHACVLPGLAARNTCLALDPTRPMSASNPAVATVEHILAAIAGLGITDAEIAVRGIEVPIDDGSARAFVEAILGAGLTDHGGTIEVLAVNQLIHVTDGDASIDVSAAPPNGGDRIWSYALEYPIESGIRPQDASLAITPEIFARDIAPARTFCTIAEAQALAATGRFGHVTPATMLVFGADGQPIDNRLRFDNEPARHKLLDLIGDLSLSGSPIHANVAATRSGHGLNRHLAASLRALARQ